MLHDSAIACPSNVVGVRGLLRGKGASLLRELATASRP